MTETKIDPPFAQPATEQMAGKKNQIILMVVILAVALGITAAVLFSGQVAKTFKGEMPGEVTHLQTELLNLANRVSTLEKRVDAMETRVGAPAALSDSVAPKQSTDDIVHLQNDLASVTSAMGALQSEVKQTGSHAVQTQRATQASLAAAIAFIQLREAALSGHSFSPELAAMRNASKSDVVFQQSLDTLESYAAKGAPTQAMLHDSLTAQETAAVQAIDKNTAQSFWQKILAELKGLISVRPLHSGNGDAFLAMESALDKDDLAAALNGFKNLPPEAQNALSDWRTNVETRQKIIETLHAISNHFTTLAADTQGEP